MRGHLIKKLVIGLIIVFIPTAIFSAPPTSTYTYVEGTTIEPSEVQTNENNIYRYLQTGVDTYADSSIVSADITDGTIESADILDGTIANADLSSSLALPDSKLATISTAGKVSGAALTSLASIPSGAGNVPSANLPGGGITLPSGAVFFMLTGSCPTGTTDVTATYSNKFIRINATQASTGGADSHTHTGGSHTHTTPDHQHNFNYTDQGANSIDSTIIGYAGQINDIPDIGEQVKVHGSGSNAQFYSLNFGTDSSGGSNTGSGGDVATSSGDNVPAYVTCKLCQVD